MRSPQATSRVRGRIAGLMVALLLMLLQAPERTAAQSEPRAGRCVPVLTQQLDAGAIDLGDAVGVQVGLDPGCSADALPRHYMLALAPWADPAAAEAVREAARTFVRGLRPASAIGATLGNGPTPRGISVGSSPAAVDGWLSGFGASSSGSDLAALVRSAHNSFAAATNPDTGLSTLTAGRRHIIVLSHAGVALGRESQLRLHLDADRDLAIEVNRICLGGGCPAIDGIQTIDVADAAGAGAELAAIEARPSPTELAWFELRALLGSAVEYEFGSALPAVARMGRDAVGAFAAWRGAQPASIGPYAYRVRPLSSGRIAVAGQALLQGVTVAGYPVQAQVAPPPDVQVRAVPDRPSACRLRAQAAAGPDPVDLGATAGVSLTLVADCPTAVRAVDVVLAIDSSASMLAGQRLADVKTAARAFVEHLDLANTRVALLTFGSQVDELAGLSQDRAALLAAVDRITAGGDTAMANGIRRAREILTARRPGALPVLVLLSDGVVHDAPQPEADWAHIEGIRLVAVCVNSEAACTPRFKPLAAPVSYFMATTDPEKLAQFYGELASYLGRADFDRLAVSAAPWPVFAYLDAQPGYDRPRVGGGGLLTWEQADPLFGRAALAYRVEARGLGRWPVAGSLQATWRDSEGGVGSASITVPELTVRPPPDDGPCRAERLDRSVAPDRLPVGALLSTTVRVDLACTSSPMPLEIVLVLDHSYSMRGQRLADTRAAVDAVLAETNAQDARFGLVAFSNIILAREPLTTDHARIRDTLASLAVNGETNIGLAIDTAVELLGAARPGARRFVVLLTDGYNSLGARPILPAADNARELGIEIIAVCAGGVCDPALKTAVSQPSFYFDVPDSAGLADLYRRIASALSGLLPTGLEIEEQLGPHLPAVPGGDLPAPQVGPNPDVWQLGFPPDSGVTITRQLTALRVGRHPASLWTRVTYRSADGRRGTLYVPPSAVTVDGAGPEVPPTALPLPTITPTPTRSPTATPSPTVFRTATPDARERGIYLPWTAAGADLRELAAPPTGPAPSATPSATATASASPSASATRTRTPLPTRTVTPTRTPIRTATPVLSPTPFAALRITQLGCFGDDELVVVKNVGTLQLQLAGWRIRTVPAGRVFAMPARFLQPDHALYIHSGPDAPLSGGDEGEIIRWTLVRRWAGETRGELTNPQGELVSQRDC